MSTWLGRGLLLFRVIIALYWALVLKAVFFSSGSAFELILINTAPLLISIHGFQLLIFLRRVNVSGAWLSHSVQVMLFGMVHLTPLLLAEHERKRGTARDKTSS